MTTPIETVEILLLVGAIVAMAVRRLKVPYTVGLVLAGVALAFLRLDVEIPLTKELVYTVFLPPLVFEAALYIKWTELRRNLPVVVTLATVGVVIAAAVAAAGMHLLVGWEWASAVLFSILIAATDPVSVIATFKEAGVTGRLRLLVESESLFNDSTAAIAFGIALAAVGAATGEIAAGPPPAAALAAAVAGGVLTGSVVAWLVLQLAGRTDEHLVEITLTTVAAYGSFLLAERLHASGVLASLTAGLIVGNVGALASFSDRGREAVESFWEYVAFVINSLVFILIGIRQGHENVAGLMVPIAVAIIVVMLGRAAAIYACCAPFARSALRVAPAQQHLLVWGGLRGALALALALGLPEGLAHREEIITVVFGVVVFSVLVQGVTITPLLRRLGEVPTGGSQSPESSLPSVPEGPGRRAH